MGKIVVPRMREYPARHRRTKAELQQDLEALEAEGVAWAKKMAKHYDDTTDIVAYCDFRRAFPARYKAVEYEVTRIFKHYHTGYISGFWGE